MMLTEREFQRQLIDVIVRKGFVYFIKLNSPLRYKAHLTHVKAISFIL